MGNILCSKLQENGKIVVEVIVDANEFRQLRGEMKDVFVFSDKVARVPSRVSLRGKNEATKYFLIPRQLRKKLAIRGEVSCQRIESEGKSIFIYVLDPVKTSNVARLPV